MREKYKMQAGGVLLSEIAACRTVAIPFINEIAFPDGVATVCKWGILFRKHDTSILRS